MIKNKLLTLVVALGFGLSAVASAADLPWLNFRFTDDTEVTVASDNLTISYSDGKLHILSATIDREFQVADLRSMYFSATAAIESVSADRKEAITLYSLDGTEVGRFADFNAAKATLPAGLYIAKGASKTIKVIF